MTDQPLEPEGPSVESKRETESPPAATAPPPPSPPEQPRRLYRSRDDRVIGGVCGGLGEYFGVDPTLIRIAFVLLVFAGGAGILAYVLAWIFIPEAPGGRLETPAAARPGGAERTDRALVLGLVFVGLGVLFLLDEAWPDFLSWKYVWPIALIAVGAAILLRARR